MDSPLQTTFTFLAVVCALLIARRGLSHKKLPPGPKGYPVIGNTLDIPKETSPWVTFAELSKQYGDVVYLNVLGQNWLVINSLPAALDLLEKRGSIYSGRPVIQMGDLMELNGRGMSFLQNNDRLKTYRKFFTKTMGTTSAARRYDVMKEEECQRFLRRLLSEPEGFASHVKYFATSIIMRMTYGYQVEGHPDQFVDLIEAAMKKFGEIMAPGRYLIEVIPWLRYVPEWFPGAGFQTFAKNFRNTMLAQMVDEPYNWTLSQMHIQEVKSFVSDSMNEETGVQEKEYIKWAANAMYSAGSDTTAVAMRAFLFAMAKYPEVQARAQAEIDGVVGSDRLPSVQDRDKLPYIRAVVSELLRWHAVTPLGIPHCVTEDDVYNGYFIPKGTVIMPNVWWMLHDPTVYPNPDEFNPSRFLKTHESDTIERDPRLACFGFGRRICPGRLMAETSLFVGCAMTLSAFNIRKIPNEELKYEFDSNAISHLKPFKCDIKPRSQKVVELIKGPLASEVLGA